ncbi:MAG: phage major capsid protein [gamma proteobacterium symbiont of Taylorina sp.]|nr:phage major capsid protein [gamma proteobacterium symbiont of Taylorina sp.]
MNKNKLILKEASSETIIHKQSVFKDVDESQRIISGLITTTNKDRDGDIITPDEIDLSSYEENPVLLLGHNPNIPIGRAISIKKEPEGIHVSFKLLDEGTTKEADQAYSMAKQGVLRAFSVGMIKSESGYELMEVSLLANPSNRESLVTEVKSLGETPTLVKSTPIVTSKNAADKNYSLNRLMKSITNNQVISGLEAEHDQEIKKNQPGRDWFGAAVPMEAIFKASGVVSPTNLAPLAGIENHDELFQRINTAIGKQLVSGQLGATVLSGLTEQTVKIPRQLSMQTAGHVVLDADLPSAGDPTFDTQNLTPKLVGSVAQLNLSSFMAVHPRVGEDFIANELRRALAVEVDRVFLEGDNATSAEEPDGILTLATDTTLSVNHDTLAVADLDAIIALLKAYLQETNPNATWALNPNFLSGLRTVLAFTGAQESASTVLGLANGTINKFNVIETLGFPVTAGTPDTSAGIFGEFNTVIHGLWSGVDVSVNPWETTVFKKGAALIRCMMMHDIAVVDPKRIRKFTTDLV